MELSSVSYQFLNYTFFLIAKNNLVRSVQIFIKLIANNKNVVIYLKKLLLDVLACRAVETNGEKDPVLQVKSM